MDAESLNLDMEIITAWWQEYTPKQMAAKLRRFADSLETGKQFRIQIAGERVARLLALPNADLG